MKIKANDFTEEFDTKSVYIVQFVKVGCETRAIIVNDSGEIYEIELKYLEVDMKEF